MSPNHSRKNRYFIELQTSAETALPRSREAELRRAQAADFINRMNEWLEERALADKVASMAVTALGQVQITCESELIGQLRDERQMDIAAIRPSMTLADSIQRIGQI